MNPSDASRELEALVDGELDLARQLALEERLAGDPALRAEHERLRALRTAIRAGAPYHRAPAALQERLQRALPPAAPAAPARGARARTARPWWAWTAVAPVLAALAAAVLAVQWLVLPWREDQRITEDVLASHARAVLAQRLVDVASSDHHTVKPWLSSRLDFSPPVDPPLAPATELLGARVDYVDHRPVAALVLRHGGHVVDDFVWPVAASDSRIVFGSERGFQLAHWTRAGMRHWVVSDLNPEEFGALVRALRERG